MIARYDISYIEKVFAPEDRVERIYINFCNPWTKRPKYAKRRLTHPRQLWQYRDFLVDGGRNLVQDGRHRTVYGIHAVFRRVRV